jgi:alpha-tubulin suppressor-like RCC1 family protein
VPAFRALKDSSCNASDAYANVAQVAVSAGNAHTCALTESGEAMAWGKDDDSQAARGLAEVKGLKFSQISAGEKHNCGIIKETEEAKCWGNDQEKQVTGLGGWQGKPLLPSKFKFKGTKFSQISAGKHHTCGIIKETEEVECQRRGSV